MSIVGTRPPLISETNLYEPRHKVNMNINIMYDDFSISRWNGFGGATGR